MGRLPLDLAGFPPRAGLTGSQRVILGIRPEAIGLEGDKPLPLPSDMIVRSTEKTGSDLFLLSRLGGASLIARLPAEKRVGDGDVVRLSIDPAKAVYFDAGDGRLIDGGAKPVEATA
jgi:multiple sugar transport system ATP-binding protein